MNLHTDKNLNNSYIANVQYFKKLKWATYLLLFGYYINKNSLDGEPSDYLRKFYIKDTFQSYMAEGHFNFNSSSVAKIAYTLLSGKFM